MKIRERLNHSRYNSEPCPYCSNRVVLPGFNSFKQKHTELLCEWDSLKNNIDPDEILPNYDYEVYWLCNNHHSYKMKIRDRLYHVEHNTEPCPYCSNRVVLPGFNSFKQKHAELIYEWDSLKNNIDPDEIFTSYNHEVYWLCNKKHSYKMKIRDRLYHVEHNTEPCPYCSNRVVLPGFNSFKQKHAELIYEWDSLKNNIDPDEIFTSYNHEVYWLCNKKHSYKMKIKERLFYSEHNTESCPYCSDRVVLPGFNSFKQKYPRLFSEWDSLQNNMDPDEILPSYNQEVYWLCNKKHSYRMRIRERLYHVEHNTEPCPYCSNKVVLPGYNSFKVINSDLMKEWNNINNYLITDPDIILPTNNTYSIYWTCENNHTYKMSPKFRILYKKRNQTACPICKGLRQPKAHYF